MWYVVSIRPDGTEGIVWSRHRTEKRANEARSNLRLRSGIRNLAVRYSEDAKSRKLR